MTTITITGDERARLSTTAFGWWESLNDWALYSDFPARGKKIAEIVLEAQEYRWRALDGAGGIFGAGGAATLEDAKANAERVCRARGTMPTKMGERVDAPQPPAWLTAAVLAALPCDGTPREIIGIYAFTGACPEARGKSFDAMDDMGRAALAHLVSTGEIEAVEGGQAWRRWGVPEGWSDWTVDEDGASNIACLADPHIAARAYRDGEWKVWDGQSYSPQWQGRAKPGRLANAKRAALRTCHAMLAALASRQPAQPLLRPASAYLDATQPGPDEPLPEHPRGPGADGLVMGVGVEGARVRVVRDALVAGLAGPAPVGAGAPAPTRAEQVRLALLAVLTRGPVEGCSHVLAALDAAPGNLGVSSVEALQAAREIGASVDGARWSLSEGPPPGWGWRRATFGLYLTPVPSSDIVADSIANIAAADSLWTVTEPGRDGKMIERGAAVDDEHAQRQALAAARRAGLFARPVAVEAPAATPAPVEPATPLAALALALCGGHTYEPGSVGMLTAEAQAAGLAPLLAAWGATLVAEARAPLADTISALTNRQTIDASGTWRVYADDGRTVIGEDVLVPHPTDPASVQAQANAILQRDTIDPAWGALEARATTAEAHAMHWQARAEQVERGAAEARTSIGVAIRQRDAAEREREEARAELAALQAGLDGLRTWATGAKGGVR